MTIIYEISQLDKKKLREIIIKNPGCLDPNLSFIDMDLGTDEGIIDFLGIDKTGGLVIVNIEVKEKNEALISMLSQVHWLKKHKDLIKRLFLTENIDFTLPPQVHLVSSSFSEKLISAAKQILIRNIKLIQYKYLINNGQDAIFFEEIFCNHVYGEYIRPTNKEESKVEDFHTFKSAIIAEEKKHVNSCGNEEISLTPEEIAEFMDFDTILEKEKISK